MLAMASSGAWAKVAPTQAAKLGGELTLMGRKPLPMKAALFQVIQVV